MIMSRFSNLEFDHKSGNDARLQQNLGDSARWLAEAQAAFEQADFEQALRLYSKSLETGPQSAAAACGQVRAFIELGRLDEANR